MCANASVQQTLTVCLVWCPNCHAGNCGVCAELGVGESVVCVCVYGVKSGGIRGVCVCVCVCVCMELRVGESVVCVWS